MGILGGGGPDWGTAGASGWVNEAETGKGPRDQDRGQRGGWVATSPKAVKWR